MCRVGVSTYGFGGHKYPVHNRSFTDALPILREYTALKSSFVEDASTVLEIFTGI